MYPPDVADTATDAPRELTRSERAANARAALLQRGVGGDALARAVANPDATRDAIKAATLAGALDALSPDQLLAPADRLKALELGAKIAGLYSDGSSVVANNVVVVMADMVTRAAAPGDDVVEGEFVPHVAPPDVTTPA